jgi:hypothetical protein
LPPNHPTERTLYLVVLAVAALLITPLPGIAAGEPSHCLRVSAKAAAFETDEATTRESATDDAWFLAAAGSDHLYALPRGGLTELYRYELPLGHHKMNAAQLSAALDRGLPPVRLPLNELRETLPRSARATGLFLQDGLLYVLAENTGFDGPRWQLAQLRSDRRSGVTLLGLATIPSAARSLRVEPRSSAWVFFEESGAVSSSEGIATAAGTVLILPKPWIKDSTSSPLYNPEAERLRCSNRSPEFLGRLASLR